MKSMYLLCLVLIMGGCTEPYVMDNSNYEDILVVEGMLTDSLQYQAIMLTRTTTVNSPSLIFENNAEVWVESDSGERITYRQSGLDTGYISEIPYQAVPGKNYTLHIKTEEGKEYISTKEATPQAFDFEQAFAKVESDEGTKGAMVYATISGTTNEPVYMRFEYEEVYKIVTYYTSVYDVSLENVDENPYMCQWYYDLILSNRTDESSVCYSNVNYSKHIILGNSNRLVSNRNNDFPVNFIPATDYRIRDRYSILIKAYSENYAAYKYYYDTKQNAAQESELTPRQPGYIKGNMSSLQNENEKVFGLFHVATMAKKRIFFEYTDFDFVKPEYFVDDCEIIELNKYQQGCMPIGDSFSLLHYIRGSHYQVVSVGIDTGSSWIIGVAKPQCSDCRTFASNVVPDFWEN